MLNGTYIMHMRGWGKYIDRGRNAHQETANTYKRDVFKNTSRGCRVFRGSRGFHCENEQPPSRTHIEEQHLSTSVSTVGTDSRQDLAILSQNERCDGSCQLRSQALRVLSKEARLPSRGRCPPVPLLSGQLSRDQWLHMQSASTYLSSNVDNSPPPTSACLAWRHSPRFNVRLSSPLC